ncbi:hypothetical protein [Collimonas arenae]|uniref:hypothetical protein n=1 Tax=Collimonas arenae TaxID=279058 RepID=UPI0012E014E5|nr:hypothetical protein [Collimonas arenae]
MQQLPLKKQWRGLKPALGQPAIAALLPQQTGGIMKKARIILAAAIRLEKPSAAAAASLRCKRTFSLRTAKPQPVHLSKEQPEQFPLKPM